MVRKIESTPGEVEAEITAGHPPEPTGDRTSASVGDRVTGILAAAEDAAQEMRRQAREEADAILHEAETASAARMRELTRDADRLRSEVQDEIRDLRLAVDAYAKRRRAEAEEYARSLREAAELKFQEAEQAAAGALKRAEEEVRRRHHELLEQTRSLHERRTKLVDELRRLAADLEEAIETVSRGSSAAETPPAESLPETLGRETRRLGRRSSSSGSS